MLTPAVLTENAHNKNETLSEVDNDKFTIETDAWLIPGTTQQPRQLNLDRMY